MSSIDKQEKELSGLEIAFRIVAINIAAAVPVLALLALDPEFVNDLKSKFEEPALTSEQVKNGCKVVEVEMGATAMPVPFVTPTIYEVICK